MAYPEITETALRQQIACFYSRARADALLGPVFAEAVTDWDSHLLTIEDFWSGMLLGARRYRGGALAAHARHPLTRQMFERWLALWGETATELFAPEPAAQLVLRAERIADSLRAGLFVLPDQPNQV